MNVQAFCQICLRKGTLALAFAALLFGASALQAALITEWDFNGPSATTVPGGSASPTPSIGAGTASLAGGTTASFASGIVNGGSSDPVATSPPNYGWNTTTFPAAMVGDRTAGVQFNVSTTGSTNIMVEYDLRHSNTSSRYEQFQYSTDGMTFVDFGAPFDGNAGDTWFNNRMIDLSSVPGVDNNSNFAFRIVSAFDAATGAYAASNSGSTYSGGGTWRFDMVQVSGTLIPEPTSTALCCVGALLLLATRYTRVM